MTHSTEICKKCKRVKCPGIIDCTKLDVNDCEKCDTYCPGLKKCKPKKKPIRQAHHRHYIYVARDKESFLISGMTKRIWMYKKSFPKMKLDQFGNFVSYHYESSEDPFYGIKLKPGEQKKVPILIDEAEKV